jgi:hypothetical protein
MVFPSCPFFPNRHSIQVYPGKPGSAPDILRLMVPFNFAWLNRILLAKEVCGFLAKSFVKNCQIS